nr:N-alpha-acetyltransferase 40 isoform X1 [Arachis hypogaea]
MDSKTPQRRRPSSVIQNGTVIREKKPKRSEVLAKKKAVEQSIKSARAEKDHLASFPEFRHFVNNGLSMCLKSGRGDTLSSPVKHYVQSLLKLNMEGPYGSEWLDEEKVKRREMVAPEAHYIFVHEDANSVGDETRMMLNAEEASTSCVEDSGPLVGFVHYRFVLEEDVPVLYVYELQIEPRVQGKGLGKFLMQLIELIAQKNCMGAVMLTVQKANLLALNFYLSKLRYIISTISPSKMGIEKSYEILCKTFNDEAKTILEVQLLSARTIRLILSDSLSLISQNTLIDSHLDHSGLRLNHYMTFSFLVLKSQFTLYDLNDYSHKNYAYF